MTNEHSAARDTILRFVTTERLLHWAIALPFLGCLVSATVLVVVYNHDPTRADRHIFAWMHRGCGTALILGPSLVLLTSGRHARLHLYNIRQAWVWTFDDLKWLALMGLAAVSKRIVLPDQGKFNAAEKLNFMMVMVCSPLFIVTGLLIWFPDTTKLGSFFPWMVHCGLAALAMPLVFGHMVMATINPSTRVGLKGMISGFVSREWAAHHYARWFREQFPDLVAEHAGGRTPQSAVIEPAPACIELRPLPAADPLPAETAPPLLAFAPGASLGIGCLDEPSAPAAASSDIPFSPPSQSSLLAEAAAVTPARRNGSARAAAGLYEPGSAVNEADETLLAARSEAPAAAEASCGDPSPDGVMTVR